NVSVTAGASPSEVGVAKAYPELRSYGFDLAVPTSWVTFKAEAAYSTSSTPRSDNYVLYVVQLERQTGEWMFVGGYAGEVLTGPRAPTPCGGGRGVGAMVGGRARKHDTRQRGWGRRDHNQKKGWGRVGKGRVLSGRGKTWARNRHWLTDTRPRRRLSRSVSTK